MLSVFMPSISMLSVFMQSVTMLNVVAPIFCFSLSTYCQQFLSKLRLKRKKEFHRRRDKRLLYIWRQRSKTFSATTSTLTLKTNKLVRLLLFKIFKLVQHLGEGHFPSKLTHFKCVIPALFVNIRLGRSLSSGRNALAYCLREKSFMTLTPVVVKGGLVTTELARNLVNNKGFRKITVS
jgi:hypothetical protein